MSSINSNNPAEVLVVAYEKDENKKRKRETQSPLDAQGGVQDAQDDKKKGSSSIWAKPQIWDHFAETYDATGGGIIPHYVSAVLLDSIPPSSIGGPLLDLGCGTGHVTEALLKASPEATIHAVDFSPKMVEKVQAKFPSAKYPKITTTTADAQDLKEFPDNHFAAIYSNLCILFIPNPVQALKEVRRVLQPGAKAVMSVWYEPVHNPIFLLGRVFDDLYPESKKEESATAFQLTSPKDFLVQLHQAGFTDVKVNVSRINITHLLDRFVSLFEPMIKRTVEQWGPTYPHIKVEDVTKEINKRLDEIVKNEGGLFAYANIALVTK